MQHGQAPAITDRACDAEDDILLADVAPRGRVRQQQMLPDEEHDVVVDLRRGRQFRQCPASNVLSDLDVRAATDLSRIVQEGREEQGAGVADRPHLVGDHRIGGP